MYSTKKICLCVLYERVCMCEGHWRWFISGKVACWSPAGQMCVSLHSSAWTYLCMCAYGFIVFYIHIINTYEGWVFDPIVCVYPQAGSVGLVTDWRRRVQLAGENNSMKIDRSSDNCITECVCVRVCEAIRAGKWGNKRRLKSKTDLEYVFSPSCIWNIFLHGSERVCVHVC